MSQHDDIDIVRELLQLLSLIQEIRPPPHIPQAHFGTFLLLCCWHIWKRRNNTVFRDDRTTLAGALLKHRISTALLRRKNMALECYSCVLCLLDETLMHLFFHCPFALACWNTLWLAHLVESELLQTLAVFRDHLQRPFFMEIIISMCWAIWSSRNDNIFRSIQHSLASCKFIFRKGLALVKLRAKGNYQPMLDQWLNSFV